MKELSVTILVLMLSFTAFAQNNLKVNFCSKAANEIKIIDLINCKLISVNNPDYKVASYSIGFKTGKDFMELNIEDNAITEKVVEVLKKHSPDFIYLEKIVLINKKGEKMNAEPVKIKK